MDGLRSVFVKEDAVRHAYPAIAALALLLPGRPATQAADAVAALDTPAFSGGPAAAGATDPDAEDAAGRTWPTSCWTKMAYAADRLRPSDLERTSGAWLVDLGSG
jgi:hypothetical protein